MVPFKTKIYRLASGKDNQGSHEDLQVGFKELIYYLWKRGGLSWLRGFFYRYRFKQCRGRLFVGKHVDILFPKYISLGRNVYLGDYTFINGLSREGFVLGNNVRIREHVWIQATSLLDDLGRGLIVGDNTYIGPRCVIGAGGGVTIGSNVTIGAAVDLLAENHNFDDPGRLINEQGVSRKGIIIEDDVWIGNRVIVLDDVQVSHGAVIGAGSVVKKNIPAYSIVAGNPARVISRRVSQTKFSDL